MKFAYPVESPGSDTPLMACRGDFDTNLGILSDIGYDGIELLIRDPANTDVEKIKKLAISHNLKIAAISLSPMQKADGLSLLNIKEDIRNVCLVKCLQTIEIADYFHAPLVIGKIRGSIQDAQGCTWSLLRQVISELCIKGKKNNVKILIEPQNRNSINNLNTIAETLDWIKQLNFSNLGLLVDIFHMESTEKSIVASIIQAKEKIGMVHMSDSERRVPSTGRIPIYPILETLEVLGFNNYVSMEIKQFPDSRTAAKLSLEILRYLNSIKK